MTKGNGIKTPEFIVELVKRALAEKSRTQGTGEPELAALSSRHYLKGVGQPTKEALERLAAFLGVSVLWLRSDFFARQGRIEFDLSEPTAICAQCGAALLTSPEGFIQVFPDGTEIEGDGILRVWPCTACSRP